MRSSSELPQRDVAENEVGGRRTGETPSRPHYARGAAQIRPPRDRLWRGGVFFWLPRRGLPGPPKTVHSPANLFPPRGGGFLKVFLPGRGGGPYPSLNRWEPTPGRAGC